MSDGQEVGALADEAVKLFSALSGWAREHSGVAGEELSGLASDAASAVHGVDERHATGSPECPVCPLCRTLHAMRQLSPEVMAHLTSAGASLAQAAVALLAPPEGASDPNHVEHIRLDDE